jgi:hypothetical protein
MSLDFLNLLLFIASMALVEAFASLELAPLRWNTQLYHTGRSGKWRLYCIGSTVLQYETSLFSMIKYLAWRKEGRQLIWWVMYVWSCFMLTMNGDVHVWLVVTWFVVEGGEKPQVIANWYKTKIVGVMQWYVGILAKALDYLIPFTVTVVWSSYSRWW